MTITKSDNQGFAHYVLIAGLVVIVAVGGAGYGVFKAHEKSNSKSSLSSSGKSYSSQSQLSSNDQAKSGATTVNTSSSSSSTPATSSSSSSKSTTSKTPTTSTSKGSSSGSGSSSSTTTKPTVTPLSALTTLIAGLQSGNNINVTASSVTVAGPVGNASARPIVFTANGVSYFAYHQGSAADFTQSAATVAGTMAITQASGSPALAPAYLDKSADLVDASSSVVGYSTGDSFYQ